MNLDAVYKKKADIVLRRIGSENIIIPIKKNISAGDSIYCQNATGVFLWDRIDGNNNIADLIEQLSMETQTSIDFIRQDVLDFMNSLINESLIESDD